MSDTATTLGLFPINAVLFPTALLPLHIFEERYKLLVNGCIESEQEFGVNLLESQKVHDVGCSARVVEVVTKYQDGRMDIVIQGMRRYRVGPLDAESRPYLVSDVEWIDEEEEEIDTMLVQRTLALYNELVETVYGGTLESLDDDEIDGDPSFKMAQKAGLELLQRQELLTIDKENARLQYLEEYLTGVLPKVKEAERVQGIIRNDGYL